MLSRGPIVLGAGPRDLKDMWHVYILKCNDGSYYTGISENVQNRLEQHNQGTASDYTSSRRPVRLMYAEECLDKNSAGKREIEIKRWSVKNKERLIRFGAGSGIPHHRKFNNGDSGLPRH